MINAEHQSHCRAASGFVCCCVEARNVSDLTNAQLVERVMKNVGHFPDPIPLPKWAYVARAFALGSNFAHQLCEKYGIDPDEIVDCKP